MTGPATTSTVVTNTDVHERPANLTEGSAANSARAATWSPATASPLTIVVILAVHAGFGAVSHVSPPPMASLHAITTLIVALWFVAVRRDPETVVLAAAYVTASEVLWRMTGASVPWEVSKLALVVLLGFAAVRIVRRPRSMGLPIVLLLLLAPSAVVTVERFGLVGGGRERLSFELAAHLALVLAVIVFANLRASPQVVAGTLWVIVAPILTVNTIATIGTVGLDAEGFAPNLSNPAASGGFGPNQVSALIGVGTLALVFLVFLDRRLPLRVLAGGLAVWFLGQSVLTFSRGGSLNLVVALLAATPFLLRTTRSAVRFITVGVGVAALVILVMGPVIENISGGQFEDRFTSGDPSLRTDLMRIELDAWGDNPWLGLGVGMMERTPEDVGAANRGELPQLPTHTEYTRLLAEHGVLGLGVILVLFALAVRSVRRQPLLVGRVFAVVLVAWCASEMAHSATRLAMVPLLFGLAALRIERDSPTRQPGGHPSGEGDGQEPVEA